MKKKSVLLGGGILLAAFVLGIGALLFRPMTLRRLTSSPNPARDYAEAVNRIEALCAQQAALPLHALCRLQFMTHGQKAEKAIVFVHGYTNCPEQFRELGQQFYKLGYNVLIVPAPHSGFADQMTTDHAQLTSEELAAYTDRVVDIAQGLGDHICLTGLSMGGVMTAWAAQHRSDLDLAVPISPAFAFKMIPASVTAAGVNAFLVLPNFYQGGDSAPNAQEGRTYTYPRKSTRALAHILRLGLAVQELAGKAPPAAGSILVVTNGGDPSVDNRVTAEVVASWREHGADVATYEFPASLLLPHDLVDPYEQNQLIVYPRLVDLINSATEKASE